MRIPNCLSWFIAAACLTAILPTSLRADDGARFDLAGPKIEVKVTRGSTTLPIAEVPNLQAGDRIWVKADIPPSQKNHLLLIVAFLRGTTNEPPDDWFTEIQTWDKKTVEGTTVTVPNEAEQALIFIAPETGGDFKTLRGAVKGRPGIFIRANADLNQASFEQERIAHYLEAMKNVPPGDPKAIQEHSEKLAATLDLKPNADCFKKPADEQVSCLTHTSAPILMNDGHEQSVAEALSSGPTSDLVNSASLTSAAGGGLYSAYVGTVVDLVHIVSLLRTAQYQYIPGLTFPQGDALNLKLNAPVSFLNPKSVIVIGLPAIQKAIAPPLRPHDPDQVACLLQPKMTLPVEGAPLVFSTSFAHDLVLHLTLNGAATDIPLKPDAYEGGLVVTKEEQRQPLRDLKQNSAAVKVDGKAGNATDPTITGVVKGYWGFDAFYGPTLTLQQVDGKDWKLVGDTQLLAGQDNKLTLKGSATACVQHIALTNTKDKDLDVAFKPASGKDDKDTLALEASLKKTAPGGYVLTIQQYGDTAKDKVPLTAYDAGIHLQQLTIHAGDKAAVLTGNGLKDVVSVEIAKQTFTPEEKGSDDTTIHLYADKGASPVEGSEASVKLKDGRLLPIKISTEAARPWLKLLSFKATATVQDGSIPLMLGAKDDIPLNGKLTFVVETKDVFPRDQTIEVATANEQVHTSLSLQANTLMLQDEHTAVATLEPLTAFGQSAFGKLQMRPLAADGTPGDWTALGTLVRSPEIIAVKCSTTDAAICSVEGRNFFLVQAFSGSKDFAKAAEVPTGDADSSLQVPAPVDGSTLYLKLRDDPNSLATLTLPTSVQKPMSADATPAPPTPAPAQTESPAPAKPQ